MKIYLDNNLGVTNVEQEELTQDTIGYNILKVYIPNAVLTPYDTFTCYYGALLQNGRKVGWFAMEARTSSDADYEENYTLYKATLEQCIVSVEGKVYIGCQVLLGNSGNATLIKKNTAVVQFNVRKSVAINNDILVLDTDQTTTDVLESYKNLLENALTTYATKAEVYTKSQVDALLLQKADKSNTYTKTEVNSALALKADKSDIYTKTEVDVKDLNLAAQMASDKLELNNQINTTNGILIATQAEVAKLKSVQNVVEVVATKSALNSYDTTKLDVNDKIQVIADETHDGASTIYNWSGSAWVYVGAYGTNAAPKATAVTHSGNQLKDYSGNNIYPNIVTYKIKGEMPYLNFELGILNTGGTISSSNQYIVSNKFKLSFDATLICDLGYKIRMYDYTNSAYLESSVINLSNGVEYSVCFAQWTTTNITNIPSFLSHFELIKNSDINQSKENSILKLGYYSLATNVLRYGNITGTNGNWQNTIGTDSNGKTTLKIQFSTANVRFVSGYRNTHTRLRVYKYALDGTYIERTHQLDGIKEYYFTLSTSNLYVFDFYYTDGTINNDSDKFYLFYDDEKLKPRLESNVIALLHQGGVIDGYVQNTIPNFIQCAKLGHKWIETDMSMTSDGVIVISHDDTRTDVNNVQVTISQTTYADLMTHQFYSDASLKIPTLQETLNIAKKYGLSLALEYKNGFDTYFKFLDAYNFIKNNGYLDHCILETWSLGYFDSMVTNGYTDAMYLCAVNSLPDLDNLDTKWVNVANNSKGIYMALNRTNIGDANITDAVLSKIRNYGVRINVFQCDTLAIVNTYASKVDSVTSNYYSVEDAINYEV